jgi:MoaA/NifB/PqqE/SkfB family radical SAM enzyme
VVLWGGEPTARTDLPRIIERLTSPLLRTDGLALGQRPAVAALAARGLAGARVPLHSGRRDANDWLMNRRGATRAVVAAARAIVAEGLHLEIEIALTRPTASHLLETVELAAHLGARAVILRRLRRRGPAEAAFVSLSPRFALLEPHLEEAARAARRHGLDVILEDLPRCAAPGQPTEAFARAPTWLVPDDVAWRAAASELEGGPSSLRCPACPGAPRCAGAPADYTALFGGLEFDSERPPGPSLLPPPVPPGTEAPDAPPPPRAGRPPSTRLRSVHEQLARDGLRGDPIAPRGHRPEARIRVSWGADEPSRAVRVRLVRAAQQGAETLEVDGGAGLRHPTAAALLREATRLSIPRLELVGELSGLAAFTDDELRRLRRYSAAVAVLEGPTPEAHDAAVGRAGAFAAACDGLTRLHAATRRRVEIAFAPTGPWTGPELPAPVRSAVAGSLL